MKERIKFMKVNERGLCLITLKTLAVEIIKKKLCSESLTIYPKFTKILLLNQKVQYYQGI